VLGELPLFHIGLSHLQCNLPHHLKGAHHSSKGEPPLPLQELSLLLGDTLLFQIDFLLLKDWLQRIQTELFWLKDYPPQLQDYPLYLKSDRECALSHLIRHLHQTEKFAKKFKKKLSTV
jgi:hypothetical protein